MELLVNVINQKLKLATNLKSLVAGTQNFIKFTFNLSDEWDDLLPFAQFIQNSTTYNVYLDENNSVYLPPEITYGVCDLTLYGTNGRIVATTNRLKLILDQNNMISDCNSTAITPTLYEQLIAKYNTISKWQSI